jgi:iron-sulfur cluster repair protein YtfE (RIC family)
MLHITAVDSTLPVNEIITRFPATIAVFDRFGIDACCGGSASVDEAADRDGVDREALIEALCAAIVAAS